MQPPASRRRHGLLVAAGTAVSNVFAYGLSIVASRQLGPDGFGQVAPLLAIVLVASVPGQALQAGVARRSVGRSEADAEAAGLVAAGLTVGAGVSLLVLACLPLLRTLLQLSGWSALLWTALSLLPQTLCFACFGLLQGRERFGRLAVALVLVQAGRLVGGSAGLLVDTSPTGALAGAAAGLLLAAVACCAVAEVRPRRPPRGLRPVLKGLVRSTSAVLSILVLTNVDVLLARNRLSPTAAGTYAAGALVAKMAFFAPSFVALLLFPRFARPAERSGALRAGAIILGASTALVVGGAAVGQGAVPLLLGDDYSALEPVVWLFAAAGSALAAVHLLVQAELAVGAHRLSGVAWTAAIVEVVVVLAVVRSVTALVAVVLCLALAVLVVGIGLEAHRRSTPAYEPTAVS